MDRDQAFDVMCEFVKSESLRKHMLAVEVCVTAYARIAASTASICLRRLSDFTNSHMTSKA